MAPLRQEQAEQVVLLERLDRRHHLRPGAEQADERLAGALGPRLARRRPTFADSVQQRTPADRVAGVRRGRGDAEHERLVVEVRVAASTLDLVVDDARRPGSRRAVAGSAPVATACRAGRARSTRHQNRSLAQSIARAPPPTRGASTRRRRRSPSRSATASWSWSSSTFVACRSGGAARSAPRAGSRPAPASSSDRALQRARRPPAGPVASAQRSTSWSRRPPRPSLRSGSSSEATSPSLRPALLADRAQLREPVARPLAPLLERPAALERRRPARVAGEPARRAGSRWRSRGRPRRGRASDFGECAAGLSFTPPSHIGYQSASATSRTSRRPPLGAGGAGPRRCRCPGTAGRRRTRRWRSSDQPAGRSAASVSNHPSTCCASRRASGRPDSVSRATSSARERRTVAPSRSGPASAPVWRASRRGRAAIRFTVRSHPSDGAETCPPYVCRNGQSRSWTCHGRGVLHPPRTRFPRRPGAGCPLRPARQPDSCARPSGARPAGRHLRPERAPLRQRAGRPPPGARLRCHPHRAQPGVDARRSSGRRRRAAALTRTSAPSPRRRARRVRRFTA